MVLGCIDKVLSAAAGTTFTPNVVLTPEREAVKVTGVSLVTAAAETENVADVAPCGTVTD